MNEKELPERLGLGTVVMRSKNTRAAASAEKRGTQLLQRPIAAYVTHPNVEAACVGARPAEESAKRRDAPAVEKAA